MSARGNCCPIAERPFRLRTKPGENPGRELISAYECDHRTADAEFLLAKAKYKAVTGREQRRDADVLCYQIRQSFRPGEITPEEANRVGYETAMRWTKGKHAFFVATHTDRQHIHNHIYYNSTTLDYTGKFRDFSDRRQPCGGSLTGYAWSMTCL
ncbi:MAG: relaxase/mobilization nuclease domain-containing protein [Flavonifractor plautii]